MPALVPLPPGWYADKGGLSVALWRKPSPHVRIPAFEGIFYQTNPIDLLIQLFTNKNVRFLSAFRRRVALNQSQFASFSRKGARPPYSSRKGAKTLSWATVSILASPHSPPEPALSECEGTSSGQALRSFDRLGTGSAWAVAISSPLAPGRIFPYK